MVRYVGNGELGGIWMDSSVACSRYCVCVWQSSAQGLREAKRNIGVTDDAVEITGVLISP